ncbi:hypothetical protein [Williamsia herbipolensis]|uniref:hypothetical protein n=1 Tax=Williamsia herbipolensis TaxID=1603258 RepID=UPI0012371981|nr:hypothetical protein [Williamsia herbipolensis]MCX6468288.1 hypothetical protein [Mycobacteriales bacterium]
MPILLDTPGTLAATLNIPRVYPIMMLQRADEAVAAVAPLVFVYVDDVVREAHRHLEVEV